MPTTNIPTRVYLITIQIEINSNTMIIAFSISPIDSHLDLTITPVTYIWYSANPFPIPETLGLNPMHIDNVNPDQIREANRLHLFIHQLYNTYNTVDKAFRYLLLASIPPIYLEIIKHDTLELGHYTALIILDHILDIYGLIDDVQLFANLEGIRVLW